VAVTKPTVRMVVESGSRAATAVRRPLSWIRSCVRSTSARPSTGPPLASTSAPLPAGTSFMPQSGQRAFGSSVTNARCIGQVKRDALPAGAGAGRSAEAVRTGGAEASSKGTRSIPQIGHSPSCSITTDGCIGQWKRSRAAECTPDEDAW
jgi:hypothetical protein